MKRIFAFFAMLMVVGGMLTVKAETAPDVKTYATDESGLFSLRCEYYKSTDYYEIILQYLDYSAYEIWDPELEKYIPNPDVRNLVFPSKVHAKFEKYNGVDDLEDDFEYVLSEQTLDDYQAARVVETITFEEGITAIPDYFYQMGTKEVDADTWEDYAANEASVLREIKFPASVTTIGDHAFVGHINLEKVTFGSGLTSIGNEAFKAVREYSMGGGMMEDPVEDVWHGALTELVLPETLSDIGDEAFQGQAQLKSLALPVNLMNIGEDAFDHTGIETLTADVPMLSLSGTSPFASCPIKKLIIPCDGTPEAFVAMVPSHLMHGVTSRFDVEFVPKPGVGEQCEGYLFYESCFENSGVQSINFLSEVVESVMYPSFVAYKRAFYNANWFKSLLLGSITCGGYVYIYEEAFKLSGLETLTLNNRVKQIGKDAFSNTRIKSVVLPQFVDPLKSEDGFTEIGEGAFYNCQQLESAKIEGAVSIMGNENWLANDIFNRCYKLSSLEIPASVTHIGSNAFTETAIKDFVGSENVVEIYPETFANCEELEKVDLSATKIERINESLFENTPKLSEIKFPEGLLLIDQYAFKQSGLKELAVPAKSNALAFTEMPNLEKISFTSDKIETLIDEVITDCPKLKEIDFGFAKTLDKEFVKNCPLYTDVVITPNIKIIDKEAFAAIKDQIKSVTYDATDMSEIADIADAPFAGYTFDLIFDKDVKLPAYVFANSKITNTPDVSHLTSWVVTAFQDAIVDSLDWHFGDFETQPFEKAARIDKLTFSEITTVKENLFKGIEIGIVDLKGIETIEEGAFSDCYLKCVANSRTLVIPGSVKTIGKQAFANNLTDNVILEKGEGLTIGEEAFLSDSYVTLTTRYDKDHIPTLGKDAFAVMGGPIGCIYAGSCDDVEVYKAADGWKDLDAMKWDGASVYQYTVEIVGETTKRPIEYYNESIALNGRTLSNVNFIGCDNKAKLEFTSPCPDLTFEHWNDPEAKDPKNYEMTLTSDTVIKIYVKETSEKIELAFRDEKYSDKAKLYFHYSFEDWAEQSVVNRNVCNYSQTDSIKVVIDDLGKYEFAGWYTYDAEKDAWTQYEYKIYDSKTETWVTVKATTDQIPCPEKAIKLYAQIRPRQYYLECYVYIDDMMNFDHFELNGVDMGTTIAESIGYGEKVELKAVGLSGAGYRYVLDYWYDYHTGNSVEENPYIFTMPEGDLQFEAHLKEATSFTITAKSNDEALGTVTMTVDPADMKGEQIWEQAAIELQADAKTSEHGRFKVWNDGELSEHRVVYATKNFEYVAIFEKDSFNIAVNAEGIAPEAVELTGAGTYGWNDDVEIKFNLKDEHYTFDAWTWEDKYSTDEVLKFKATEHLNVTARFQAKTYTITVLAEPAEGGKVTVEGTPVYSTLVKLKAEANEGYEFAGWKDDAEAPALRPVEVLGDATYTALFKKKTGTGVEDVQSDDVPCTKVLRDGVILIERDGKTFDVTGRRLK